MKKALFLLTLFFTFISMQALSQTDVAAVTKAEIDGIVYEFDTPEKGEATVTYKAKGGSNDYIGDIVIPKSITHNEQTYMVTAIGDNAFAHCSNLASVSMPITIETLGDKAFFQCTGIITIRCDALTPPDVPSSMSFHKMDADRVTLIVPGQSITLYATHEYWKKFIYTPANDSESGGSNNDSGTTIVTKTNYEIYDSNTLFLEKPITLGQQDTNPAYNEYNMVSYIRNFKNTNWQALYVPVELVYSDWSENFEIAKIHSILETGGMFYAMADVLESDDTVEPHTLYLIRAKEVGEYTINVTKTHNTDMYDNTLHRVYTSNTDTLGTAPVIATSESFMGESGATYTFTGQYAAAPLKEADYTQPPYLYAMTGGELKRPNPDYASGIPLGAFRWWLQVTPGIQGLMFSTGRIDHSDTTDVESIMIDLNEVEGLDIYYDLNGRPVENPTNGIYIKNGKKILVK